MLLTWVTPASVKPGYASFFVGILSFPSMLSTLCLSRYTEAYEREWRQKERAARERVAATNRDLAEARAAQQAARVAAQADMARLEAQEFHRIVEENRHIEQQQLEKASLVKAMLFCCCTCGQCSSWANCAFVLACL